MKNPVKRGVMGTLLVLAFIAPSSVAYALWSTTTTTTVSVSIAAPTSSSPPALPAPVTFECGAPTSVGQGAGNSGWTVSWSSVVGAARYEIYRGTTLVRDVPSGTTSYLIRNDVEASQNSGVFTVHAVSDSTTRSSGSPTITLTKTQNSTTCADSTP